MKNQVLLFFAGITLFSLSSFSSAPGKDKTCVLTISWQFKNVEEGYDHETKCKVWIDGEEVGESSVKKETQPNKMVIQTQQGNHDIRVVNYALYEGEWEEHTIENNYSIDCILEEEVNLRKKTSIALVFDIDEGTSRKIK